MRLNRYPNLAHETQLYQSYLDYIERDLGHPIALGTRNLLFTRGAADGIDLILRTFALSDSLNLSVTDPTFFPILHWAKHYGLTVESERLLGAHFTTFECKSLLNKNASMCFLIHPNNPTTTCLDPDLLTEIITTFKGLLIVDEAYIDFCHHKTVIHNIQHYPNLIVLRSLSKAWGCAGLRAGFIIANEKLIGALQKIQAPFMCDVFSCDYLSSLFTNRYADYCDYRALILQTRDDLIEWINHTKRYHALPSETNFILIAGDELSGLASRFHMQLIQHKMITIQGKSYLKFSVGTPLEMRLIKESILPKETYATVF